MRVVKKVEERESHIEGDFASQLVNDVSNKQLITIIDTLQGPVEVQHLPVDIQAAFLKAQDFIRYVDEK
ncbi:hypothetical protein [Bacillus sp. CGMCC 1.16541]|uniref:hypothetical protein n=1 Tax=Bacillus sp. CGMCC 1.16541 TaxID=2185143 RepID=UPI000D72B09B|nr:hypothetical protein [Bacillus sp. CGMCC 1.16541]